MKVERKIAYYNESNGEVDESWKKELTKEASDKGQLAEFPAGLSKKELTSLWHLSKVILLLILY